MEGAVERSSFAVVFVCIGSEMGDVVKALLKIPDEKTSQLLLIDEMLGMDIYEYTNVAYTVEYIKKWIDQCSTEQLRPKYENFKLSDEMRFDSNSRKKVNMFLCHVFVTIYCRILNSYLCGVKMFSVIFD